MFKLLKNIVAVAWVKFQFIISLKWLKLEIQFQEIFVSRGHVKIDVHKAGQSFITLCEFVHANIVQRVTAVNILLTQNLSISIGESLRVLPKEINNSDAKIFMSLYSICVMEYG